MTKCKCFGPYCCTADCSCRHTSKNQRFDAPTSNGPAAGGNMHQNVENWNAENLCGHYGEWAESLITITYWQQML